MTSALVRAAACSSFFVVALAAARAQPPVMAIDMHEASATVESVDQSTRQILLRLGDTKYETLIAGPEVRNFAQIKAGDRIKLQYQESLLVRVGRPGGAPLTDQVWAAHRTAKPGEKPGIERRLEAHRRVKVAEIDLTGNNVTFEGADKTPQTVHVRLPQMQQYLHTLKVGDELVVDYRRAVLARVEEAQ